MNKSRDGQETSTTEGEREILLSICILSYNQVSEVDRLLTSLTSQITNDVEIIIRDDSTNNDTELLVEKFSKVIPIRYYRGKKEGIDKTVIFLTKEARGRFVWWMGDDEVVAGGVSKVLEVIKREHDVTFIWANYRLVNGTKLAIDLLADCFFESRDQLLEKGGTALGFVSATVFKRELSIPGVDLAKNYIGSAFVNLYLVLYVISQPGKHYFIRGEVVICHPATSEEAKASVVSEHGLINNWAFQVFGINFSNIVKGFSNTFSVSAIRRTIKTSFGQTWRGILVAYVGGWDTPKGKRIQMIKYFWMYPECWIALMLFAIPLPVLKKSYKLYRWVCRR
jgi:glycosyltransferase involved in cell wall biosynthesis